MLPMSLPIDLEFQCGDAWLPPSSNSQRETLLELGVKQDLGAKQQSAHGYWLLELLFDQWYHTLKKRGPAL